MAGVRISIPKERRAGERRIAASVDMVKKLSAMGVSVAIESGAGTNAALADAALAEAGAEISDDVAALLAGADVVLKVRGLLGGGDEEPDELAMMNSGAVLVGLLDPYGERPRIDDYASRGITAFSMEFIPRISRAQPMDALSSQSNIAGYKAAIEAAAAFGRIFPMMMTAAGTIAPARVLVLGAGVAGLQAIATARRLGGVISAFDVRPAVKEQVESLGARFIEVPAEKDEEGEDLGGYAKEMGAGYQRRQADLIHETLKKTDIVITTALIPGKPAPRLITEAMLNDMRAGSVVVDLAVGAGGNCAGSEPDQTTTYRGVTIVGPSNLPARVAVDTSALYARNLLSFLGLIINQENGELAIDWEDEIISGALLTRDGAVVHPNLVSA